jgi:hypothetical protein
MDSEGWFHGKSLVYHGLGPLEAHMFYHCMPISVIVALHYGEEVERHIEKEWGTKVFSYEKMNGLRLNDSADYHNHFYHDHGREIADCLGTLGGEVCFVPFSPSTATHEFLFKHARFCRHMQNLKIVQDYFEFKTRLALETKKIGIPMLPDSLVLNLNELEYRKLVDEFESGFVVQVPLSAEGSGADFVFNEDDFERVVALKRHQLGGAFSETQVRITPFLSGPSMNCAGCVVNGAVALSQPDTRIVGDPHFAKTQGQYTGSDFTVHALSSEQRRLVFDVTERIGGWMGSHGYRGNFGVEFLSTVDSENRIKDIYVSEVNARLVAESQYMTDSQAMKDCVPLTFFHLAEWSGIQEITPAHVREYNDALPELEGSALILYSRDRGTFQAEGGITAGVYRYEDGAIRRVRDGYLLSQTENSEEFVITAGVPWKGLVLGHPRYGDDNVYTCSILTRESIVDPHNYRVISEKWREIADTTYEALGLVPCEPRLLLKEKSA